MGDSFLVENVHVATFDPSISARYGVIDDAVMCIKKNKIVWVGTWQESQRVASLARVRRIDGQGRWVTPGFIDCHTHLVYGGHRAKEFEMRLEGATYEEIANAGGGILSTLASTRKASKKELFETAKARLERLAREGVTTLEIKSGYGLDVANEIKMLEVIRDLNQAVPQHIQATFLGAHAVPPEYKDDAGAYITLVTERMLPLVAEQKLADAVDVFCESIAFSAAQCQQVFKKAVELGLPVKGHVEQLSDQKGAALVASFKGLSADHVEYLGEDGIRALKASGTVPVLLPSAFYFLKETQMPPIDALRQQRVEFAIATDLNPGSSPCASLLLSMNQACLLFGCTVEEALVGVTRAAAHALGLGESKGQIKVGFDADFLCWDIESLAELCYGINLYRPASIWINGVLCDV